MQGNRTTEESSAKIDLLSQWKLEAEFRNKFANTILMCFNQRSNLCLSFDIHHLQYLENVS